MLTILSVCISVMAIAFAAFAIQQANRISRMNDVLYEQVTRMIAELEREGAKR